MLGQHVPKNHTNLFQSLDISVNKEAKGFLSNKYEDWYRIQVSKQLEKGVEPHDIKIDVILTKLKPLHAGWVMDYHKEIQSFSSVVKSGFQKANILETFKEDAADALINLSKQKILKQTKTEKQFTYVCYLKRSLAFIKTLVLNSPKFSCTMDVFLCILVCSNPVVGCFLPTKNY